MGTARRKSCCKRRKNDLPSDENRSANSPFSFRELPESVFFTRVMFTTAGARSGDDRASVDVEISQDDVGDV